MSSLGRALPVKKKRPKKSKPAAVQELSPVEKLQEHLEDKQLAKDWLKRSNADLFKK